jgi:hypothetical protein
MTIKAHREENAAGNSPACTAMDIDLESCHKVINALMEVLQQNFKRDTNYERPLMSPQSNIIFALDEDVALRMMDYMSLKLREMGGFDDSEFCFTHKTGTNGEVLQRLRLEFPDGVNAKVIRKLLAATDMLEKAEPVC